MTYRHPNDIVAPVVEDDSLDAHHAVLSELVDLLLAEGQGIAQARWNEVRAYRPARTINSHVRAGELKTIRSLAAPNL